MSKVKMICSCCGSTNVLRDAYVEWDEEAQEWSLQNIFDHAVCEDCDGNETSIDEIPTNKAILYRATFGPKRREFYAFTDSTARARAYCYAQNQDTGWSDLQRCFNYDEDEWIDVA